MTATANLLTLFWVHSNLSMLSQENKDQDRPGPVTGHDDKMQNALQQVMVPIVLACLCILVILAGQAISSGV